MSETLYLRKHRLKKSPNDDHRTLFRFTKENTKWLATLFLGESTTKEYFTALQKMKLCLKFLANSARDEEKEDDDYVVDAQVSKTISTVIVKIVAAADNWIKFPQSPYAVMEAKEKWQSHNIFPTAIGVLASTHIRLKKSKEYKDEYINVNGVYSVNLQATCDAKEVFTSLDTRWPGSSDVVQIWKSSVIRHIMATNRRAVLLADEEYETEPWLMTPFLNPSDDLQVQYNKVLKAELSIIKRCFRQVKRRFPILQCVSCMKHETASDIITVCFVLHNIAKHLGEEDFDEEEVDCDNVHKKFNKNNIEEIISDVRNNLTQEIYYNNEANIKQLGCKMRDSFTQFELFDIPDTPVLMMSNTNSTTYANALQRHSRPATTIDYLNQNATANLATYPSVATQDTGLLLDKQPATAYYSPQPPNPAATYYSTQLVQEAPGTILITSNFAPDESSTISGVNNNLNNSSIRIVTHNNNNNNHTNNNNNNNIKLECNVSQQQIQQQPQQHYHHHHLHHQPAPTMIHHPPLTSQQNPVKNMPNSIVTAATPGPTTTSTVVLDRINICINNHYGDSAAKATSPPSEAVSIPINPPPLVPMTKSQSQHTPIVDKMVPHVPSPTMKIDSISVDDEPDSTTPTHCLSEPMEQDLHNISTGEDKCMPFDIFTIQKFEIGEDALVQRRDGRYYLGTVVDVHRQQYLVQFDDNTDYWSNGDELMKLSTDVLCKEKPTCLACKRENDDDVVETCERCGRGYHRQCTDEVSPKSDEWMCKRCQLPMKYSLNDEPDEKLRQKKKGCRKAVKQLPYALDSLTWDQKHRVNLEQIYCYCGKSGQFDNNMIQCCKCKQWFHSQCVDCVRMLFRGDVFFIFGCSVCNKGKEFLRRIEMEWVDLAHLVLYNMAIMKNFQKYHHLQKDIYPFALEKRIAFQLPAPMLNLSDSEFKAMLLNTLQAHPKLFQCGKEIKKDHSFWGLRSNKPPQGPTYDVTRNQVLCNYLIREKLKIKILPYIEEDDDDDDKEEPPKESPKDEKLSPQPPATKTKHHSNMKDKVDDDDDDKFTSDDEIPIKLIIEKVKTSNSTLDLRETTKPPEAEIDLSDQSNGHRSDEKEKKEKKEKKDDSTTAGVVKLQQKNSRKRKAFTLSKGYKDSDKSNKLPRNICDSSSDENSSSSRGTLDLIIPPPKDFLGINNPFRIVTPKKSDNAAISAVGASTKGGSNSGNSCITKKTVTFGSNSIFNNTLDLNSKIAALKSSGLFPNISNSDIAKAAGQPRLVRTIKRRLSAKDIMIGPNQEVRRRRTRPLSSNVEVISTTTINSIPSNFFPIRATIPDSTNTTNSSKTTTSSSQSNLPRITLSDCIPSVTAATTTTTYGRRLRKRPEKTSPQNSRRNSMSSSSSSNSCTLPPPSTTTQQQNAVPMSDLKQSVNKYFGAANRIENGEKFNIRAKRRLTSGHMQYLIEWES